jgi:5,10-methylene-tetrahydrofolate dehydrogenase/methenyl tetrahydrofolate cyclohydrolase
MSLSTMAQTSDIIPYHADGEQCIYYTAAEINEIIAAMNNHKIYHTTYYNALKAYINSLETIEEISAITYGTPIPDEYKTEVLKVIGQ